MGARPGLTDRRAAAARIRAMRGVVAVLLGALVLAGGAAGGGTIRAFVLLPGQGRLAIADAGGSIVRMVAVPAGAGPVAAGIDGREVLVANTRRGLVTELDGLSGRRRHVFARLGHPIALVMVPRPSVGLVQPRYAIAADAGGRLDVLDLRLGRTVRRIHVARPVALALSEPYLWVASAGRQRLTQLDVTDVPHVRVITHPDVQVPAVALAPTRSMVSTRSQATGRWFGSAASRRRASWSHGSAA